MQRCDATLTNTSAARLALRSLPLSQSSAMLTLGLEGDRSFGGQAFFCNSGTEANEAAIKFARHATGRKGFVSAMRGFHCPAPRL